MSKRVVIVGGVAAGMKTAALAQAGCRSRDYRAGTRTAAELWRMRLPVFYQR